MALYRNSLTWTAMFGVITLMFVKLPPMVARQDSVLHTYSALVEVDALARQRYVSPIGDDRLVDGAIRGMMRQLDPYSGYISSEELPGFLRRSRGQFCSVGLEVGLRDGIMSVISPIEGGPAARAGIQAGDRLLHVAGRDVEHLSTFEVEEMLVGATGTQVTLTYRRGDNPASREVTLAREQVSLQTVRGVRRTPDGAWDFWLDPDAGIGYIRVSNFRETTATEFDAALAQLTRPRLQALVLDLRFNPGGFLHQAVAMADRFLADGLIVSTVNRLSAVDEFRAEPGPADVSAPLFVLLNGGSASASEIVAGALQARARAKIVGERSFGKGSVQHLIQLTGHKAAIKLTVAYYRLPDGRIIHRTENGRGMTQSGEWGIEPDVEVVLTAEESHRLQEARRLFDLAGASGSPMSPEAFDVREDRQLQTALTLARASTR